ncbi:MAG: gluconokinase, partial [Pricia sp.]|nr:gluconokinase [Pricia sp.]
FFDADNYHPPENVKKMASGNPLNDKDRQGWLERLNLLAKENIKIGAVIACSSLKQNHRTLLQQNIEDLTRFVYLKGSYEDISERINQRKGHFMPPELLKSQFKALEHPEEAVTVSINNTPEEIVINILRQLNTKN